MYWKYGRRLPEIGVFNIITQQHENTSVSECLLAPFVAFAFANLRRHTSIAEYFLAFCLEFQSATDVKTV